MLLHPHLPVVWSPYNFLIVLAETRQNNWRDCLYHRGDTGRESQTLMCLRVILTSLLLCNAAGPSGWSAEWIPKSRVKASVPQQFISLCKGNKKFSKSLLLISRLVSLSPTPHPPALFAQVCALLQPCDCGRLTLRPQVTSSGRNSAS